MYVHVIPLVQHAVSHKAHNTPILKAPVNPFQIRSRQQEQAVCLEHGVPGPYHMMEPRWVLYCLGADNSIKIVFWQELC